MTNDQIKEIALKSGFKLKEQSDGSIDLNPYVYDFARAMVETQNTRLFAEIDCALRLNHVFDYQGRTAREGAYSHCLDIIQRSQDALAGVEEEDGDWISIKKDKKPRDGQRCLVLDDYGYMYVKPYIAKYSVFDGMLAATITHWRPLPKRPRKRAL